METNVNYTIVGAFVISLLTAIIFAIIWLSSGFSFETFSTYKAYMQESVSGLSVDSPVEFNGVSVGTVKSVELNNQNPHEVELLLSIKSTTPITTGTVATLNTRGVTGITFIALKDDGTDLRPLEKSKDEDYPVIKTAPSLFMRLDTALQKLSANLQKVSESIQSVLDPENRQSIKLTLRNMQIITSSLAANNKKFGIILENTARASAQFLPLIQSSRGAMNVLEMQTLPAAYHLLNNLDDVTRTLSQVSIQLKQNPSVLIRGTGQPLLGPGEQ